MTTTDVIVTLEHKSEIKLDKLDKFCLFILCVKMTRMKRKMKRKKNRNSCALGRELKSRDRRTGRDKSWKMRFTEHKVVSRETAFPRRLYKRRELPRARTICDLSSSVPWRAYRRVAQKSMCISYGENSTGPSPSYQRIEYRWTWKIALSPAHRLRPSQCTGCPAAGYLYLAIRQAESRARRPTNILQISELLFNQKANSHLRKLPCKISPSAFQKIHMSCSYWCKIRTFLLFCKIRLFLAFLILKAEAWSTIRACFDVKNQNF